MGGFLEYRSIQAPQMDMETGPFAPIIHNRAPRPLNSPFKSPFKVVAFNARGCPEPEQVAEFLRRPPLSGAAIILLSEADWALTRSRGRHTAKELAELLGMSFAFGPEFAFRRDDHRFNSFFGNAILSVVPLANVRVVPLPMYYDYRMRRRWKLAPGTTRLARRAAVAAEINLNGRALTVVAAHLENRTDPHGRARQMAELAGALPRNHPALIGGDFNTTTIDVRSWRNCARVGARLALEPYRLRRPQRHEPLFDVLERAGFEFGAANLPLAPTFTPSGALPRFLRAKLDWIGLRKLTAVPGSARVVPARLGLRRISDHDAVMCEFTF
jgi:endonuclease/exonuclease/phosphatase family metal-dependent hydrolase